MKKLSILAAGLLTSAMMFTALAQAPLRQTDRPPAEIEIQRLDSLMGIFHQKYYSFKDDIEKMNVYGFDTNDIPSYPDDVIRYRLSLLESPIPLEYNQYVKGFVDLYAVRKKKLTQNILTWSKYYFPIFEQILDEQGMPLEFKYLAVIESALNPNAQSWCGATGLWQFMYGTGLMYGLKIDSYVDERKDPIKATYAACQYFKDMYALYHDWLLVIAAYNCGPGNVNRAIRMSGGHYNFWKIMPYLPTETRGYVPAFIAATYVLNYHSEHNIFPRDQAPVDYATDTVHVNSKVTFAQLSQSLQLDEEKLKMLNPSYKLGVLPHPNENGKSHVLRLPYHKAISFTDLKENIYASSYPNYYRQQAAISESIAEADNKQEETLSSIHKDTRKATTQKPKVAYYRVRRGDGLYTIASRYGCSVQDIKRWNRLHSQAIHPGQVLTIYKG